MTANDEDKDGRSQHEGGGHDDPAHVDEVFEGDTQERSWDANVKRTYDLYQASEIDDVHALRGERSRREAVHQSSDGNREHVALQALQNAVRHSDALAQNAITTIDMTAKQAVRHSDIAIDRQWNIDEQSIIAAGVIAAVVKAIQDPATLEALTAAATAATRNK